MLLLSDYDMESVTSMMSVSANDGVGNLDDDDGDQLDFADHSAETSAQLAEYTSKFSELLKDDEEKDEGLKGKEKEKQENVESSKSNAEKRQFEARTGQLLLFFVCLNFMVSGGQKSFLGAMNFYCTRDASLR